MNASRHIAASFFSSMLFLTSAAAAGDEDKEKAKALFEKGVDDMEIGRYKIACPELAESHRLDPRPGTLFTLAECEATRGRIATAVMRYDEYLTMYATLSPDKQAKQGTRPQDALAQKATLGPQVPELTLVLPPGAPPGTEVKLDGAVLLASSLGVAATVDPGAHVVTTQAPRGPMTERKVVISKNEKLSIVVEVAPAPVPERPPPPPAASPEAPLPIATQKRSPTPAIVMGGLGAAGVVVGLIAAAAYAGKASEAKTLSDKIRQRNGSCSPGAMAQDLSCYDLHHTAMVGDNYGTASIVAFTLGGVMGITTTIALLAPKQQPAHPAIQVSPIVSKTSGALVATWRF